MPKFIKKSELISDGGVDITTNIIDFAVTFSCILVSIGLIVLGVLTYASV